MKRQLVIQPLIILIFYLIGWGIKTLFHLPLPGSVMGMLLLFLSLVTGVIKLEWVEKLASFQIKHLTLLFIPPIVSLFLSNGWIHFLQWNILFVLVISSLCCLLGTAFSVELYEKLKGDTKRD
ncbi:CidA/LrgA family protein [Pullulanibacillus sp. KACC 23026]|uniref:CidA/LrgA family protein n=1 Tax=Pullulanibacillus sp. KACC 23026 TaxID=3028315 RepID=UPI0023AF66D4|nr:CidA/LrgA family protein [Pullulanibacillus sp. KACC 23026]WEG12979.1 CidA/LrgA family protein [Pullulanibacillus sp. KACC 23026]